jgi:hypothetical protein
MSKTRTPEGGKNAAERDISISPSEFMRGLRPEYYSDTEDRELYVLDDATFSYHLETITSRNQHHEFETFCRKLCERAICANLRVQTGPEGGGDSKVDTETFPVADEISLTYVGTPNSGREKWAFAFSAKKTWSKWVPSKRCWLSPLKCWGAFCCSRLKRPTTRMRQWLCACLIQRVRTSPASRLQFGR